MPDFSLQLTRNQLVKAAGLLMGLGLDPTTYSTNDRAMIDHCVDVGLRSIYSPLPLPGETTPHVWSFLTPIGSLTLVADTYDYLLPADFAGFTDNQIYLTSDSISWCEIKVTNPGRILALRERNTTPVSGPPQFVAVTVVPPVGTTSPTRNTLMIWPTPEGDDYELRFEYKSNPYQITDDEAYPLGGQDHVETVREAILAAVEREVMGIEGVHNANFMRRLIASVGSDRSAMGPAYLGQNLDRSNRPRIIDRYSSRLVTINGTTPG